MQKRHTFAVYYSTITLNSLAMITINNVTFGYRKHQEVLDGFTLEFAGGGIYGLLGKNGTGKSTLLYLMMGLLRPQKGDVTIDGTSARLRRPEVLSEMFLVPEEYDLPAVSLKSYVGAIKPFYPRFSEVLLEKTLQNFDMTSDINLGQLSMGQKKKVYMSVAIASNTRYLLMDEPTNGLDILSKSQFRKAIIDGMTDERTVIVSTHQVHDVERLLDHICIIERNRVLLNEPLVEKDAAIDLEELFIKTVQTP